MVKRGLPIDSLAITPAFTSRPEVDVKRIPIEPNLCKEAETKFSEASESRFTQVLHSDNSRGIAKRFPVSEKGGELVLLLPSFISTIVPHSFRRYIHLPSYFVR